MQNQKTQLIIDGKHFSAVSQKDVKVTATIGRRKMEVKNGKFIGCDIIFQKFEDGMPLGESSIIPDCDVNLTIRAFNNNLHNWKAFHPADSVII